MNLHVKLWLLALLLAVSVYGFCASAADAHHRLTDAQKIARALPVAQAAWDSPCRGREVRRQDAGY